MAALGLLLTASLVDAPPAEAAYRYWSYWRRPPAATGWTYSTSGPSYRVPDGAVEGWRFQDYGAANPSDPPPRSTATFEQICASVPAAEGMKRVAITVDFGSSGGVASHCVRIASSATGDDALAQRARDLNRPTPRYNASGLLCSIDGRPPAPECGKQVESPRPTPTSARPTPRGTTAPPAASQRPPSTAPATGDPGPTSARTPSADTRPAAQGTARASASASAAQALATRPPAPAPDGSAEPELVLDTPTPGGRPDGRGFPVTTLVGAAVVAALGGAATLRMRSRP